ncbi:hypothetical protein Tco_1323713 [Tanacetum coccineum]
MKSQDFNKDLMRRFIRHGTDSTIFFGHAHINDFRNCITRYIPQCLERIDQASLNSAAGVGTSTSTPGISPDVAALTIDVAELKDMMKTLILDKQKSQAHATVKAVEEKCVTCGGAHSYRNCLATDGNVYRDNIQEYVSQAATANFNQGNTGYRPQIANQIRPPGFPPV